MLRTNLYNDVRVKQQWGRKPNARAAHQHSLHSAASSPLPPHANWHRRGTWLLSYNFSCNIASTCLAVIHTFAVYNNHARDDITRSVDAVNLYNFKWLEMGTPRNYRAKSKRRMGMKKDLVQPDVNRHVGRWSRRTRKEERWCSGLALRAIVLIEIALKDSHIQLKGGEKYAFRFFLSVQMRNDSWTESSYELDWVTASVLQYSTDFP